MRGTIKVGMISNPRSHGNQRGLRDVLDALPPGQLLHERLDDHRNLAEVLAEFARQEVGLLVINGGDGTVQHVLTELLERPAFPEPPRIAILPRGTANMTAGDVGLHGGDGAALERLLALARNGSIAPHLVTRSVLRVQDVRDVPPQRCMFLGAAAIYDAIEFCCREVYARGVRGNLGMGLALIGLLLGGVVGRQNAVFRPHQVAVGLDGDAPAAQSLLLVFATTLERLILGSRPFWNQDAAPIHYTSIAYPPERVLCSAPKVLYGWRRSSLPAGYFSRGARSIELHLDGSRFTLDGEMFEPAGPLRLSAEDTVEFVRL